MESRIALAGPGDRDLWEVCKGAQHLSSSSLTISASAPPSQVPRYLALLLRRRRHATQVTAQVAVRRTTPAPAIATISIAGAGSSTVTTGPSWPPPCPLPSGISRAGVGIGFPSGEGAGVTNGVGTAVGGRVRQEGVETQQHRNESGTLRLPGHRAKFVAV